MGVREWYLAPADPQPNGVVPAGLLLPVVLLAGVLLTEAGVRVGRW